MSHFIALQYSIHKNAGYQKAQNYIHAKNDTVAPVIWEEISQVTANIPSCFISTEQDNQQSFQLVALQGLQANQNLLIHPENHTWLFGYIPSHYRGYPFALLKDEITQNQVLCIDNESGLLKEANTTETTAFYDDNGQPTQLIKNTLEFLKLRQSGLFQTQSLVTQLSKAGLIVPWNIHLKNQDDQTLPLRGLFKIDEEKLKALEPEIQHMLIKSGAMMLAYAQLMSEVRLTNLQKIWHAHQKINKEQEIPDLDKFFDDNDESLKF